MILKSLLIKGQIHARVLGNSLNLVSQGVTDDIIEPVPDKDTKDPLRSSLPGPQRANPVFLGTAPVDPVTSPYIDSSSTLNSSKLPSIQLMRLEDVNSGEYASVNSAVSGGSSSQQ